MLYFYFSPCRYSVPAAQVIHPLCLMSPMLSLFGFALIAIMCTAVPRIGSQKTQPSTYPDVNREEVVSKHISMTTSSLLHGVLCGPCNLGLYSTQTGGCAFFFFFFPLHPTCVGNVLLQVLIKQGSMLTPPQL